MLRKTGIIHGDIKPENVLIFKDDSSKYVAKVADFGYSTVFAGSGGILMPRSATWVAPEWKGGCEFRFCDARKMDAYSFGMLCLWLLLFDFPGPLNLNTLRERDTDMIAFANELVKQKADLSVLQRQNLSKIFSLTLNDNPDKRTLDFDEILSCLTTER
jgi:serine/threonine protein kinase